MANYDGSIVYFNINYDSAFYTIINNDFYCIDEVAAKKICDYCGDDWYVLNPDKEIQFYFNDAKYTIEHFERVHLLANKSQDYAILLFIEGEDVNLRNIHLSLINRQSGDCIKWSPTLRSNYRDWRIIGVANTTPNTKVVVMGYEEKFIAFFSTVMTWSMDGQDYQCILSDITIDNYGTKSYIASMDGSFSLEIRNTKFISPNISNVYPFRAISCFVIADRDNVFTSIGDVFEAIQDTSSASSKITYNNVDYCRYVTAGSYWDTQAPRLWFRIYGGSNDV